MKVHTHLPGNAGFRPADETVYLVATTAVTKGTIYTVAIDTATAANDGVATDQDAATLGTQEESIFILALEDLASGETGEFMVTGWADVIAAAGGLAAKDAFSSDANGLATAVSIGAKCLGFVPEAIAAAATGKVWFDGWGMTQAVSVID